MRKLLPLLLGGLILGSAAAQAGERPDHEAELARALNGRVAEAPVDCVDLRRIRGTRIITDTAILYDAGSVIYVNRPRAGADSLDRWDTLVTRLYSNRLCSIDTVQLVDSTSSIMSGVVFLGEFVPYRRVRTSSAD
jgi:hypothetical protein